MVLDLTNTQVAFQARSDKELLRSFFLFKIMSYPWMVRLGSRLCLALLKLHIPIGWIIRTTVFRQFCGGENVIECGETIAKLARFHVGTILDYSIEANQTEKAYQDTYKEVLSTIRLASQHPEIPFTVFKVTAIARYELIQKIHEKHSLTANEKAEWTRVEQRFLNLCEEAYKNKVRILVDAEETWLQDPIDELAHQAMARYNREKATVYNTLQMYRVDGTANLKSMHAQAQKAGYSLALKLVRGAYMEKEWQRAKERGLPSPLLENKTLVDTAYDDATLFCLDQPNLHVCLGTHNERSVEIATQRMQEKRISNGDLRIYFAQLFGMGDHLSFNLAKQGFNVAKYVPYGPIRSMVPYLIRRAEENTAIGGQTLRELNLISKELSDRKKKH